MPESHRGTLSLLAGDNVGEVDAVEARLMRNLGSGDFQESRVDVGCASGCVDSAGRVFGRPFQNRRNAQAALVDAAFFVAAAGRFLHQPAVVAAIPNERVVGDAQVAKALSQFAELLIQQGDLQVIAAVLPSLLVKIFAAGKVDRRFLERPMRRRKPGDGEHRLGAILVLFQEVDRGVHADDGALSLDVLILAVAAQVGIDIEEVESGQPFIKARSARAGRAVGLH